MNKLINISLFQKHITFGTIRVVKFLSFCVSPFFQEVQSLMTVAFFFLKMNTF